MEIIYTKTRRGNESIIHEGNIYNKARVSQNGDIAYRCLFKEMCIASIVTDSDGVYVKKQATTHSDECIERKAKVKNEPRARKLLNETTSGNVRILKVYPKKTSITQTHYYDNLELEFVHSENQNGNKTIAYDGFLYRKERVSLNGNITYRCGAKKCTASIVMKADGINLNKMLTSHREKCYARRRGELQARKDTLDQKQSVFTANQKKALSIIRTQDSAMEIVHSETKQGNKSIIYDGFKYRKAHVSLKGNIAWRCCTNSNCKASIVMKADGKNVVKMNTSHREECYAKRQSKVQTRKKIDNQKCHEQKGQRQSKLRVAFRKNTDKDHEWKAKTQKQLCARKLSIDTQTLKTFQDSGNTNNLTPAAASRDPVSVTPVSTTSLVSRQHEDDENPMVTETFDHAMPVPQVFIKTEVDVSSTTNVESQEINPADGIRKELDNLFRKQQTQIENANKQNELLLASVLSKRQKKAKAETQKLSQMKKELAKLDNSLATDVTHIRDRIENVSQKIVKAQERYSKAEREFNDAKLDLQQISELKEQLTEHLKSVIQQNEVHKACKLQEFMSELEIESPSYEAIPLNSLPPQSSFGIHGVSTFYSPLTSLKSSLSSSTSHVSFTPYSSQSTDEPASSLLQSASSGTQQHSLVPQLTYSDPQPSSSVLEPDSSVPYPVSLSVAPQVAIRLEYLTTVNRMDTESPISIHSDTSWDENSDIDT